MNPHVYTGSVWRWQGFRTVTLPHESRDDGATATVPSKPPADAGASVSNQADSVEPPSRRAAV